MRQLLPNNTSMVKDVLFRPLLASSSNGKEQERLVCPSYLPALWAIITNTFFSTDVTKDISMAAVLK